MKKDDSVLIIGSTGLVGQAFTSHLAHSGPFSTVFAASRDGKIKWPVQNVVIDICLEEDLSGFFDTHKPTLVINASGIPGYQICEQNPDLAHKVNVAGVKKLLEHLDYKGVTLIQFSTNAVFGCGEG